jgi:hypothetical protein
MIYLQIEIPVEYQDYHYWTDPSSLPIYKEIYKTSLEYKKILHTKLKTFNNYQIAQYTRIDLSNLDEKLELWYDLYSKKVTIGLKGIYDTQAKSIEFGNLYNLPMRIFSEAKNLIK